MGFSTLTYVLNIAHFFIYFRYSSLCVSLFMKVIKIVDKKQIEFQ